MWWNMIFIMDSKYFEGECINGVRNGRGKGFYESSDISFEGEYLNGLRNGEGKEYYLSNKN